MRIFAAKLYRMKRHILLIIIAVMSVVATASAQKEASAFEAKLYGGIYIENDQAWTLEPSVAWHLHKYFGVAFGGELTSQYNQSSRFIDINGVEGRLEDNERNIRWMAFKPSFVFKSPSIRLDKDGDIRLWFQAEPGVSLACPFRNSLTFRYPSYDDKFGKVWSYKRLQNDDLRWFYFFGRVSANFSIGNLTLGVGYSISDFDYYSCRRHVMLPSGGRFSVPARSVSQTVFLSAGWRF